MAAFAVVTVISVADASRQIRTYRLEPPQTAIYDVAPRGSNFASAPAIRDGALIYEAMAQGRYLLRMPGRDLEFEGEALHPSLARQGPVYFELVAGGRSRICAYDLVGGKLETVIGPEGDPREPAISPDGSRLAFVSRGALFVQQIEVVSSRVTSSPAFFPDSEQIAFADGLPGRRSIPGGLACDSRSAHAGGRRRRIRSGRIARWEIPRIHQGGTRSAPSLAAKSCGRNPPEADSRRVQQRNALWGTGLPLGRIRQRLRPRHGASGALPPTHRGKVTVKVLPSAWLAGQFHHAAVRFRNPLDDRQSQPEPAIASRTRLVRSEESLEDMTRFVRADPNARI